MAGRIGTRGIGAGAAETGTGAKVNPTRLKGVKVISGASGLIINALAGTVTAAGNVGIRLLTPTPPVVATGTVGNVGAGNKLVVVGTLASR